VDAPASGRERHESEKSIAQRSQRGDGVGGGDSSADTAATMRESSARGTNYRTDDRGLNSPQKFKGHRFFCRFAGAPTPSGRWLPGSRNSRPAAAVSTSFGSLISLNSSLCGLCDLCAMLSPFLIGSRIQAGGLLVVIWSFSLNPPP
jgi:hypothetical protein